MDEKRILCVEDHPDTCELIALILDDCEVVSVNTKTEGLRRAARGSHGLYLFDYHLPDGTGEELARAVRVFDRRTPIIFVTGTSSLSAADVAAIGAQGLVRKGSLSFIADLRYKVRRFLSGRAVRPAERD